MVCVFLILLTVAADTPGSSIAVLNQESCFSIWGEYNNSDKAALHLFRLVAWTSTYIFKKQNEESWLLINSISDYITAEKLTPPLNVTVNCTEASHACEIRWQPPHTSHVKRHACFKYEIVIENKVRTIMTLNSILHDCISTHATIQPHPVLLPYLNNLSFLICSTPLAHELRTAVTHKQGQQTERTLSVHCACWSLKKLGKGFPTVEVNSYSSTYRGMDHTTWRLHSEQLKDASNEL